MAKKYVPDKNLLSEYEDCLALIAETERDLQRLKAEFNHAAVDIVKGSNPNYPYEPRNFRIEGISYSEYKNPDEIREVEAILKERKENCKAKRLEIERWMNTIPVSIARIIRMKYFEKLTWADVSLRLGYLSPNATRTKLDRYLKEQSENVEKKPKNEWEEYYEDA